MSQFKQAGRGRGEQWSQKSTEGKGIGLETPPRTTRRSTRLKNKEENDSRNKQEEERKSEADNPFAVLHMDEDDESEEGERRETIFPLRTTSEKEQL